MDDLETIHTAAKIIIKLVNDPIYPHKVVEDELARYKEEIRLQAIEDAALLLEENANAFERSNETRLAWQLRHEARHIRELKGIKE